MKKQTIFSLALSLVFSSLFAAAAEPVVLREADLADASQWEFSASPAPYAEEKARWGVCEELNGHALEGGEAFWGISGLKKNEDGKSYYHELSFAPVPLAGVSNAFLEFSYFAEGLDKGENLQWFLTVDDTNMFGAAARSDLDTSSLWERVALPLPAEADHAGLSFRIKQSGATDFAGIGKIRILGLPFPERGAPPKLAVRTSFWDRVELELSAEPFGSLLCRSLAGADFVTNRPNAGQNYARGDLLGNCLVVSADEERLEDEDVVPGSTYYYKAWGRNENGLYSCGSRVESVTVPELPLPRMILPSVENDTLDDCRALVLRPDLDPRLTVLFDLATSPEFLPHPGLFISEYGKGAGDNRYLELYNPLAAPLELENYSVCVFKNGSDVAGQRIALFGTLQPKETLLICNNKACEDLLELADLTTSKLDFTGNDAVALLRDDEIADVIGVVGEDPGSAWPVGEYAVGTANHTLVRIPSVNAGTARWKTNQWEVLGKDFFSDLKRHDCGNEKEGSLVFEGMSLPEEGIALSNLLPSTSYYLRGKTAYKGATGVYGPVCGPFKLIPEPGMFLLSLLVPLVWLKRRF